MNKKEKTAVNISESVLKTKNEKIKQISPPSYDKSEKWVQEYIEQFGKEPGFF